MATAPTAEASTTSDAERTLTVRLGTQCSQTLSTSVAISTANDGEDIEARRTYLDKRCGIRPKQARPAYYFHALEHGGHSDQLWNEWSDLLLSAQSSKPYWSKEMAEEERFCLEVAHYDIVLDLDDLHPSSPKRDEYEQKEWKELDHKYNYPGFRNE